jgi:hypothetical protein
MDTVKEKLYRVFIFDKEYIALVMNVFTCISFTEDMQ